LGIYSSNTLIVQKGTNSETDMRLVFVSDAHVFQSPTANYNPLPDLKRALEKVVELEPDLVIFAGDMFDYKHSLLSFVKWFEGEDVMLSIRPILRKLGRVCAIRGNHEREEILRGIAQTVENFDYMMDRSLELDGMQIWFVDTRYELGPEEGRKAIERVCEEARRYGKGKILVIHENVGQMESPIPDETLKLASTTFDFVFNGHCHVFTTYRWKNFYLLPSLLPSRLRWGSYWLERYTWRAEDETPLVKQRDSPYGFVILEGDVVRFVPFTPSKKIVEVSIGVDNLGLEEIKKRFEKVLSGLEEAIVLPEIHGVIRFPPQAVEQYLRERGDWIGELRKNTTSPPFQRSEIQLPQLPNLEEIICRQAAIAARATEHLTEASIRRAFLSLLEEGRLGNPRSSPSDRLKDLLLPMFGDLRSKPKFFERDLEEIFSVVRKPRK
jgi:predicted phosphodiesterase